MKELQLQFRQQNGDSQPIVWRYFISKKNIRTTLFAIEFKTISRKNLNSETAKSNFAREIKSPSTSYIQKGTEWIWAKEMVLRTLETGFCSFVRQVTNRTT